MEQRWCCWLTVHTPPWWIQCSQSSSRTGYGTLRWCPSCGPGSSRTRRCTSGDKQARHFLLRSSKVAWLQVRWMSGGWILEERGPTLWERIPMAEELPMLPWAPVWDIMWSRSGEERQGNCWLLDVYMAIVLGIIENACKHQSLCFTVVCMHIS